MECCGTQGPMGEGEEYPTTMSFNVNNETKV